MDRVRRFLTDRVAYEPLDDSAEADAGEHRHDVHGQERHLPRFSWLEYSVFFLLGVSMLWAWSVLQQQNPPVILWRIITAFHSRATDHSGVSLGTCS